MSTAAIAKLFGVSPSTIKRWVKQLEIEEVRNEQGHYIFLDEHIEQFRDHQERISSSSPIKLEEEKVVRRAVLHVDQTHKHTDQTHKIDKLYIKVTNLEHSIDQKADSVVTYQLLQHRSEIEELQTLVRELSARIEVLEKKPIEIKHLTVSDNLVAMDRKKHLAKTNKIRMLTKMFGF